MRVLPFKSDKDIGVIHGGIKPQNVLVFKDAITREITVKVADFGHSTLTMANPGRFYCQSQGHGMLLSIISGSSRPMKPKRRIFSHLVYCVFGSCLGICLLILMLNTRDCMLCSVHNSSNTGVVFCF